jgi:guanylate kinase
MSQPSTESGMLLVVSAPSGAGKTSLVNALVAGDSNIVVSVSHTTRPRRGAERDGEDYFFVDRERFKRMCDTGDFLARWCSATTTALPSRGGTATGAAGTFCRDRLAALSRSAQLRRHIAVHPAASRVRLRERLRSRDMTSHPPAHHRSHEMSHHHEQYYLVK